MAIVCEPGTIVAGRYRLDRLLGQGGMGIVWAATHTVTRRAVAMKFVRGTLLQQPELRRRLLREAHAAAAVRHPNVVEILDVFELDADTPVIVMDLLQGETLGQRLAREQQVLSLAETARLLLPAISAIGTAHARGIVHRDLKPDNIYLAESETGLVVKVLDFGIAKLTHVLHPGDASIATQTGSTLGTPSYMAPEQAAGEKDVDHRADIWALGVILYECLSGMRPIEGDNVGQVVMRLMTTGITPLERVTRGLPEDVTSLVGRMLSRERTLRPQDLREVQRLLAQHSDAPLREFGAPRSEIPTAFPEHSSGLSDHGGGSRHRARQLETDSAIVDTNGPHAVPSTVGKRPKRIAAMVLATLAASIVLAWRLLTNTSEPTRASVAAIDAGFTSTSAASPARESGQDAAPAARFPSVPIEQVAPFPVHIDAGGPVTSTTAKREFKTKPQTPRQSNRSAEVRASSAPPATTRVTDPAAPASAPSSIGAVSAPHPASPRRSGLVDKAPF